MTRNSISAHLQILHDLRPTPRSWSQTLPLARRAINQADNSLLPTYPALRCVSRLWFHAQGGRQIYERTLVDRVAHLLAMIFFREQRERYSVHQATHEVAHDLGLPSAEADELVRQALEARPDFVCTPDTQEYICLERPDDTSLRSV